MTLTLLLAAAFGSANMSFPWWVWLLAVLDTSNTMRVIVKETKP